MPDDNAERPPNCNHTIPCSVDIIPLHRVFGYSLIDAVEGTKPAQGYMRAEFDERCDSCGDDPSDWLFDCDEHGTLCRKCAEKVLPNEMQHVVEINNIT